VGNRITIVIADGSRLFAEALKMALWWSKDLEPVEEVALSGPVAVETAVRRRPDVLLLDNRIPEMDGLAVISALKERTPKTKVILMSWLHSVADIESGLAAGAVGFLPKSSSVEQVAEAARAAQRGEAPVYAQELQALVDMLNERSDKKAEVRRRLAGLTPREMTVLRLLSYGRSIPDIAKELDIAPHTVKLHFHNGVRKSGAITKEQALAMARYCGMIST